MNLYSLFSFFHKLFPARSVFAHCDVPCGIYTLEPAKTAVATVIKMIEKLYVQVPPADNADRREWLEFENTLARCIAVKEDHAQLCKKELLILWTDYFKPEHVALFPDLHEKFWKAAKLCSRVKQEVTMEVALQLKTAVEEIAEIFEKTHGVKS
ncbi:MAG: superoxide dismutase, Ni [Nanoarchaeota archaeon]|nr:superoxide dismutase, Ni [Nanoarchaeota archaeon]